MAQATPTPHNAANDPTASATTATSVAPQPPTRRGAGVGLLIGVNLLWLPLSMLFNSLQSLVLPFYVAGISSPLKQATTLGLLLFVGLAAGALVQPLAGIASDRLRGAGWLGRRTPFILVGTLLTLALLVGFAFANSLLTLALAYIGVNIAAGVAQAGAQGLMPDLIPTRQRGSAAGLKSLLELLGSVVGFSVAGMLIRRGNLGGVSLAIGIILAVGALLTLAFVREGRADAALQAQEPTLATGTAPDATPTPATTTTASPVSGLAQIASQQRLSELNATAQADARANRSIWARVLVSRLFFLLAVYGIGHFLLYFVRARLHLVGASSASVTSGILTALTLVTALVGLGGGWLSDRVGRLPVLWVAGIASAIGVVILIPATTLPLIYVGGAVMSLGSGLFASANWALAADLAPTGNGGRFFGLLALATGGAAALAGLLGPLVDYAGYNALFALAAVFFVVGVAIIPRTVGQRVVAPVAV